MALSIASDPATPALSNGCDVRPEASWWSMTFALCHSLDPRVSYAAPDRGRSATLWRLLLKKRLTAFCTAGWLLGSASPTSEDLRAASSSYTSLPPRLATALRKANCFPTVIVRSPSASSRLPSRPRDRRHSPFTSSAAKRSATSTRPTGAHSTPLQISLKVGILRPSDNRHARRTHEPSGTPAHRPRSTCVQRRADRAALPPPLRSSPAGGRGRNCLAVATAPARQVSSRPPAADHHRPRPPRLAASHRSPPGPSHPRTSRAAAPCCLMWCSPPRPAPSVREAAL